jgi:hypothetical protein
MGEIRNACTKFWLEILKERNRWEENIKVDVRRTGFEGVIGFIWLRIGTGGRLF